MQFSLDTVRAVTQLLQESELAEISLETTGPDATPSHLIVRRQAPARALRRPTAASGSDSTGIPTTVGSNGTAAGDSSSEVSENGFALAPDDENITISATAVGLFRCAQPAVKAGDKVKLGQVVGIVESLKIPNEVMAPLAGEITEVLAEEGQAVEYGQPLLIISPLQ